MSSTILIVEDDSALSTFIQELLKKNNFVVDACANGSMALEKIKKRPYDVVLLDLGLPDITGETVLETIRQEHPTLQVIVLTAKSSVADVVKGFKLGADDYVAKPFPAEILLARIRARLKNSSTQEPLKVADLVLDPTTYTVKRNNKEIELTPMEFKLLKYLMENKDTVMSRDQILNAVWGYNADVETRVVDVFVGYVRRKVCYPFKKPLIKSVRGFGYMLSDKIR